MTFIEYVIFSEAAASSCDWLWTAGYRSTTNSAFVWRLTSSDTNSDVVSPMNYTNWIAGQPDESGNVCIYLHNGYFYAWADNPCGYPRCSVCELDV